MKIFKTLITFLLLTSVAIAQEDSEMEAVFAEMAEDSKDGQDHFVPSFKAMKICNLQSTKVVSGGEFYMYVSHRFGSMNEGISTFFGLDNANTKIQFVYGLVDGLQIGIARESLRRTYSGSTKMKLWDQGADFPLTLTGYSTINVNTEISKDRYPNMKDADRLSYATQLLMARRFSKKFSLLLAPSFVRQNLVWEATQDHNQYVLALGARYQLTGSVSLTTDYSMHLNRNEGSTYKDPFALGLDIETGGHVFQLLFSNAQSTNAPSFLANAEGDWWTGDIFFGFNIVRVF